MDEVLSFVVGFGVESVVVDIMTKPFVSLLEHLMINLGQYYLGNNIGCVRPDQEPVCLPVSGILSGFIQKISQQREAVVLF